MSEQVKAYQYSTTMPEEHRDGNPKFQTMLLVYVELVVSPYTVQGGCQENYYRKNDENERESKLYFLVPDDFDRLKFAKTLKKAAEDMIKKEQNAGKGWAFASTAEHFFRLIFGPKSYRSQGTNKQKKVRRQGDEQKKRKRN